MTEGVDTLHAATKKLLEQPNVYWVSRFGMLATVAIVDVEKKTAEVRGLQCPNAHLAEKAEKYFWEARK